MTQTSLFIILLFCLVKPSFAQFREEFLIETKIDAEDYSAQEEFEENLRQTIFENPKLGFPTLRAIKKEIHLKNLVRYKFVVGWNKDSEFETHDINPEILKMPEDIKIQAQLTKPTKSALPGLKIDNIVSINAYENNFVQTPKLNRFEKAKQNTTEDIGTGRIQFFFDLSKAIKSTNSARIILTAGFYSRFAEVTGFGKNELSPPTVKFHLPTQATVNFGVNIRLDSKKKKQLNLNWNP